MSLDLFALRDTAAGHVAAGFPPLPPPAGARPSNPGQHSLPESATGLDVRAQAKRVANPEFLMANSWCCWTAAPNDALEGPSGHRPAGHPWRERGPSSSCCCCTSKWKPPYRYPRKSLRPRAAVGPAAGPGDARYHIPCAWTSVSKGEGRQRRPRSCGGRAAAAAVTRPLPLHGPLTEYPDPSRRGTCRTRRASRGSICARDGTGEDGLRSVSGGPL